MEFDASRAHILFRAPDQMRTCKSLTVTAATRLYQAILLIFHLQDLYD